MPEDILDLRDTLTLFSAFRSSCSARVRLLLALKGILVQLQPIDLDELSDTYIALNPSRAVPALLIRQDGGDVVLTQSMAIMEYIEEVWPDRGFGRVLPMDPIQRAAVRALCQIVISDVQPTHRRSLQKKIESLGGNGRDWAQEVCTDAVALLETHLSSSPYHMPDSGSNYCFFDKITLADIVIYPFVINCARFGVNREEVGKSAPQIMRIWEFLKGLEKDRQGVLGAALWSASWKNQPDTPDDLKVI